MDLEHILGWGEQLTTRLPGTGFFVGAASASDAQVLRDHQLGHAQEVEGLHLDAVRVLEGVLAVFENPHLGFYVVARKDSGHTGSGAGAPVVASLLVTKEWSDWRARHVWWIQSVYVEPPFRRRGVFSMMFREVERMAYEQNAAGLRLYVERNNIGAQRIYQRLGMTTDHYVMFEKMLH